MRNGFAVGFDEAACRLAVDHTTVRSGLLHLLAFGRRTISWDRSRLTAGTIEELQCMSNWVRNDLIRKVYVSVDDDVIEVGGDDKISGASDLYS